ncbi:hypothetical protein ACQEU6_27405 [Spirillospora sp. CA-108201]
MNLCRRRSQRASPAGTAPHVIQTLVSVHIRDLLANAASRGIEVPETYRRLPERGLDQIGRFGRIHWKRSQGGDEWEIKITRGIFTYSGRISVQHT